MKKCGKCSNNLPLTVEYFSRCTRSKDGFKSDCKECRGGRYGVARPNLVYGHDEGYQFCSKCRKLLPLTREYFNLNASVLSGYSCICKICMGGAKTYGIHRVYIQKTAQDGFKYCNKCLRELPLASDYFYTDKRTKRGFSSHCKECKGQKFGETKPHPHIPGTAKVGYYVCRCCKKELPLNSEHFNKLASWATGYNYYCKKCSDSKRSYFIKKTIDKYRATDVIKSQRRRSLKKSLPSTLTDEQWEEVKFHFNNRCAYCNSDKPLAQDHFLSLSHGGFYEQSNIIPACKSCNSSKGAKPYSEWHHKQPHYTKEREAKIYKYLGYSKQGIQQLSLI